MRAAHAGVVSLLDEDPDLGDRLHGEQLQVARRVSRAGAVVLDRQGRWEPHRDPVVAGAGYGLLIVEGVLARRLELGGRRSLELLAPGDIPCALLADDDPDASMRHHSAWRVVMPARLVLLSDDLMAGLAGLAGLPGLHGELQRRSERRARELGLRLLVLSESRLAPRLELLLWSLVDRWGKRSRDGVVITLPLTQQLLADLAGANRSSTARALGKLGARGVIGRRESSLILLGAPPAALAA